MKATVYTREPNTRKLSRAKAKFYAAGTVFVVRIGKTWETLGTVSFAEAKAVASQRELDIHRGMQAMRLPLPQAQPAKPNVLTLGACVDRYLNFLRTKALATRQAYGLALRQFLRAVGDKPVAEITKEDLAKFHLSLKTDGFSDRTCANRVGYAVGLLRHFNVKDVSIRIKYVEQKVRAYRPDELKALFAAAAPGEWLLFQFLLCTGCREMEAVHAEKSDIDFVDGVLTVREKPGWRPKDCEQREIPLPDFLLDALRDRPAGLLFPGAGERQDSHLIRRLKQLAKRARIGGSWTLHKFRKTYATVQHKSGVDARTIQKRLGHSSLETTLAYLEGEDARSKRSRSQVNGAFAAFA